VKNLVTFLSKFAITAWQILSTFSVGTTAIKSSPPICPINESSGKYSCTHFNIVSGLPGNVQIHAELKKRLSKGESFSVLYLDLDNFKAYNDVYGFLIIYSDFL